jgi:hypothetical protein
LHVARERFSIQLFAEQLGCTDKDLREARARLYRTFLLRLERWCRYAKRAENARLGGAAA